ncbi:MAG: conjugal transfer protein TraX [Oscillibacter sp.]|nr:conjugal transfer protein TraX [Oscillibacter sp.]
MTHTKSVDALTLKWIAIVTMLIDHAGHVCYRWLGWSETYLLMRYIGRMAFPIFVFLLLEGFRYTRNRWAYLRNLLIFALISEIPFDLAVSGWERRWESQNIFWTLSLGLFGVMAAGLLFRACEKRHAPRPVSLFAALLPMAAAVCAGQWMRVDYHFWGVLIVALVYCGEAAAPYLFGDNATPQLSRNIGAALGIVLWAVLYDIAHAWINEVYGLVALVPVLCYNGERGHYRLSKWFFYGFYPAHLLILFLCRDTVFKWLLAG